MRAPAAPMGRGGGYDGSTLRPAARHVRIWLAVIVTVVVVGSLGYVVLLNWSVGDALYMTVMTVTTVGFREVRELDGIGRAWTMLLAVSGVAIIFGSIGIVAETILSEVASGRQERRHMEDAVKAQRGHFILCGYGRVGSTVARELAHAHVSFVVIDSDADSLAAAARDGFLVVDGDATRDDVLLRAGVDRARGLITTVDSDANNVYVTLSARAINPGLFIVGRANQEGAEVKLLQAGANRAVSPYARAGRQIAELATRPRVADFIDFALSHGDLAFSIEEVEVVEDGPLVGRTVASLTAEGAHLLAIVRESRGYEPNPPPERELQAGDGLILSGTADALRAWTQRA